MLNNFFNEIKIKYLKEIGVGGLGGGGGCGGEGERERALGIVEKPCM
jgi:hypothetical protein